MLKNKQKHVNFDDLPESVKRKHLSKERDLQRNKKRTEKHLQQDASLEDDYENK